MALIGFPGAAGVTDWAWSEQIETSARTTPMTNRRIIGTYVQCSALTTLRLRRFARRWTADLDQESRERVAA